MDEALDMTEAKAKLKDLKTHMPEADEFLCLFGDYLAVG
jgi:hypothetical protein